MIKPVRVLVSKYQKLLLSKTFVISVIFWAGYFLLDNVLLAQFQFRYAYILLFILVGVGYFIIHKGSKILYRYGLFAQLLLGLFAVTILYSTLLSINPAQTLLGVVYYGDGIVLLSMAMLFLVLLSKRIAISLQFVQYWYITIVSVSVLSLVMYAPQLLSGTRLGGVFLQPNTMAIFAGIGVIIGLYLFSRKIPFRLFVLSQSVLIIVILLSQTRAVFLYILAIVVVYAATHLRKNIKHIAQHKILIATVSIAILLAASSIFIRTFHVSRFAFGLEFRAQLASYATSHHPYISLWGLGKDNTTHILSYEQFVPFPDLIAQSIDTDRVSIESVHTILVDIWLQYGYVGVAILIAVLVACVYRVVTDRSDKELWLLGSILLFLLIQLSVAHLYFELALPVLFCIFMILRRPAGELRYVPLYYPVLFTIAAVLLGTVSIASANKVSSRRLSKLAVFPLDTSKAQLLIGSSYNNESLSWDNTTTQSYHHTYPAADLHASPGTPVRSAVGGRVVLVREQACDGGSRFPVVQIRGFDGLYYLYSHLEPKSTIHKAGDYVETGEYIGRVGDSTCSQNTAPHLHFDISRFPGASRDGGLWQHLFIDPQMYLSEQYQKLPE